MKVEVQPHISFSLISKVSSLIMRTLATYLLAEFMDAVCQQGVHEMDESLSRGY